MRQTDVSLSCATVIRLFVYGLPTLLLALIAVSFVNVSLLSTKKKNEMLIGTLGEPSTLNPIQQADAAAGEVQAVIFNGLLKYDQNLEITTDLAKSFTLSQTTTIFFQDANAALSAMLKVQAENSRWQEWKLNSVSIRDSRLLLELSEPGMDNSRKIVSLFDTSTIVLSSHCPRGFAGQGKGYPRCLPDDIRRFANCPEWIESSAAFEVTVAGDSGRFLRKLEAFLDKTRTQGPRRNCANRAIPGRTGSCLYAEGRVRWHDGEPFTSRDVAFTYRAIMDDATASPRKPDFLYIPRIETPDPHTVRVIYRKPYSPALSSWMIGMCQLTSSMARHRTGGQ